MKCTKSSITATKLNPSSPATTVHEITYADLSLAVSRHQELRPLPLHEDHLNSDFVVSYADLRLDMSTRHSLPVGTEQLSAQLYCPQTPPPVPCRTYRSTEGERQPKNIIDDAQSSIGSHPLALSETNGESESHPPIPSRTYRDRVTEASPHNLQSTISIDDEIAQLDEAYLCLLYTSDAADE